MTHRNIAFIGKLLFITLTVIVIVNVVDFDEFAEITKTISWPYFVLVCLIIIFDQAFMGFKWNVLLRAFHVVVPFHIPILSYLRGRIFSFVAPSSFGMDTYKTYVIHKYHGKKAPVVSSIIVERGLGFLSSLAIVLVMLPFSVEKLDLPFSNYIGWTSSTGLLLLLLTIHFLQARANLVLGFRFPNAFPEKAHQLLERLVVNLAKIQQERRKIWFYFALSVLEKSSYGLAIYFSCMALGLIKVELLYILAAAPVVAMLERIPVSVSAIGLREGMLVVLLFPFYQDPTTSIAASLTLRAGEIVQMLVFTLTWIVGRDQKTRGSELAKIDDEYSHNINDDLQSTKQR